MSSISLSVSRKRLHSSGYRESDDSDLDIDLPPIKIRKYAHHRIPIAIKEKLQNFAVWITDLPLKNFFTMALKSGTNIHQEVILDDIDEEGEDDVQEITEVDPEQLAPLIEKFELRPKLYSGGSTMHNGSYLIKSRFDTCEINGSSSKGWSPKYKRNGSYNSRESRTDNLKRSAIVSNPGTDIEILLGTKPKLPPVEADEIEILSELPSIKQKHASSHKSFRVSRSSSTKSSFSAGHSSTSTSVKRLQSSTAKVFTANEVVRLQEKAQYKLLLDKFVTGPHYKHVTNKPQSVDVGVQADIKFTGSHFKKEVLQQPIKSFIDQYYKPYQPPPSDKVKQATEKEPLEIKIDDDDEEEEDEDLQILEVKLPRVKPKFHSTKYFSTEWISEVKSAVNASMIERLKICEEQERMLERYRKERLLNQLSIDGKSVEAEFPELTPEMEEEVDKALNPSPEEALCKINNTSDLIRKDIETLGGLSWLNDAVINSYFDLIVARSKQEGYPSVYAYNTFFYSTYKTKGYQGVQRWTRKLDIFSYDLNFVPIHLSVHWCLAVIDHRSKKICYYDSMGNGEEICLEILHDYLSHEYKNKKGKPLDVCTYTTEVMKDIPQQMNGSDCGIFTLKYAEYVSRDAEITFNQSHMHYFRRRTVYELLKGQLL